MALKNCKECGHEVSSKADKCPNCGNPIKKQPKQYGCGSLVLIGGLGFFIYALISSGDGTYTSTSYTPTSSSSSSGSTSSSATPVQPMPAWNVSTSKDEMSGKLQVHAMSKSVSPTKIMSFPYSDVKSWIGIGCEGNKEWAYFGFTSAPNITDDEAQSGGYSSMNTRIKWDERVENVRLTQEWGDKFISISDDSSAIQNIIASNTLLLELNWHGQGSVYFKYRLKGSSKAVSEMRSKCK